MTIDLNADLGEGDACDLELLDVVSSCNIACGAHAGDAATMRTTAREALARGVVIGAHPGYPDRVGRGRRSAFLGGDDLLKILVDQLYSLNSIVAELGGTLRHVKPHGALYSDAASTSRVAARIVAATRTVVPQAAIVGPPQSALQTQAQQAGLPFFAEGFVDRAYLPDGSLVPRAEPGAVHADINTITTQAVRLACDGEVGAQDGSVISLVVATLCIHGDTANAATAARAVRDVLLANGVRIRAAH